MPDIVISEFMDEAAVDSLSDEFVTHYDPTLVDDRERFLALLGDARALVVRNRTLVDSDLLDVSPRLAVIGRLGVGLDNIDMTACSAYGVEVKPATGANTAAVAEYVIAAVMVLIRGVFLSTDRVLDGSWPRTESMGGEVAGRQLGLIGLGSIAREVAAHARGLGMTVVAHDPHLPMDDPAWATVERATLDEVLAQSHAVSVHVPLTDETRSLINHATISKMRPGSVLVNTARGGIVEESALVSALRSGHLAGAAIDVFAVEPVSKESGSHLAQTPNLIVTPHIAGITEESDARVGRTTVENVRGVLRGKLAT
ncbi:MAG: hydroxyacid dehydrogenase [Actinomycetota bacterium]|nr:hydroxyacid dehydrogenase [Actinomycetota bacterium]